MWLHVKDDGTIIAMHNHPDSLSEDVRKNGVLYDGSIPQPNSILGKEAIMKFDLTNKKVFYDYVDRPFTQEEQMEALKAENQALNTAVVELYEIVLGGI